MRGYPDAAVCAPLPLAGGVGGGAGSFQRFFHVSPSPSPSRKREGNLKETIA